MNHNKQPILAAHGLVRDFARLTCRGKRPCQTIASTCAKHHLFDPSIQSQGFHYLQLSEDTCLPEWHPLISATLMASFNKHYAHVR